MCNELCYCLSILVPYSTEYFPILPVNTSMQFYSTHPNVAPGRHPEYSYPTGPVATSPRINWSPTMHPGAWSPYDFAAYPAAYPPTSADPAQRSPPYQVSSPNDHSGTPHNIRDILGGQQQGTLLSEIAKTPSGYQKSPTSTAVSGAMTFSDHHIRSPTTPTVPPHGIVYSSEVPSSFYVPRPLPGSQFAFDSCASVTQKSLGCDNLLEQAACVDNGAFCEQLGCRAIGEGPTLFL